MLIDFLYETLIDLVLTGQLPLINLQAVSFENVLLPFCISIQQMINILTLQWQVTY